MTEIKSIVEKCRVIDEVDNTKSIIYFDPNFYDDFKYPIDLIYKLGKVYPISI